MQASLRAVEKKQLPHMLAVTNMLLHGIEEPVLPAPRQHPGPALHLVGKERMSGSTSC